MKLINQTHSVARKEEVENHKIKTTTIVHRRHIDNCCSCRRLLIDHQRILAERHCSFSAFHTDIIDRARERLINAGDICLLGFFAGPRMTNAIVRWSLSFYYSYRHSPGSLIVGVVSPPTSRDNYVRRTILGDTRGRDCKMSYVRSLSNGRRAVVCSA